jgi:hypothetical protein
VGERVGDEGKDGKRMTMMMTALDRLVTRIAEYLEDMKITGQLG